VAAALALVVTLPALWADLGLDDYWHRNALRGGGLQTLGQRPLLQLFNYLPGDPAGRSALEQTGIVGWWASPDLRGSFFRPLAVASHLLDYALWPDAIVLQHAHSLLWYALGVLAVALLLRQVGRDPRALAAAGLAALMFAVDEAHCLPAGWLANRNAVMALVFGALGLLWHIRWRRRGGPGRLALSLLLLALSLLSAEAALGVLAYLAAYQLVLDRGPLRRRLLGLLPALLLVAGWRWLHGGLGYGVVASGMYIDPLVEPRQFLRGLLDRGPVLLLAQWAQVMIDSWMALPRALQVGLTAAGLLLLAGLAALFLPLLRRSPEARFWALGMLLSLVPAASAFPMGRLNLFVGIGACGLLATHAYSLDIRGGKHGQGGGWRRRVTGALVWVHLPLAVPLMVLSLVLLPHVMGQVTRVSTTATGNRPAVARQTLIVVNGIDLVTIYLPSILEERGLPVPRHTAQLASAFSQLRLRRVDPRTLEITAGDGFLERDADRLMWSPTRPFRAGQTRQRPGYTARVLRVTADGRPRTVRFRFGVPLEHPSLLWRVFQDGALRPLSLPPPGEEVDLPPSAASILL
jgi:hypothetical protein